MSAANSLLSPEQMIALQARNTELEQQVEQLRQALAWSDSRCQRSEVRLDHVLDSTLASIFSLRLYPDHTIKYDYVSPGCERVFGYTAEEFMADSTLWRSNVHPEDLNRVILPVWEAALSGKSNQIHAIEYQFCHPDGSVRWISASIVARWEASALCCLITVVDTDISDRKQAELALQESEACNRAILAAMPDLLLRVTSDGTCLDCILPQHPETATPFVPIASLAEILPPETLKGELQAIQQAIATRQLQTFELQLIKQGNVAYEEVRIAAVDRSDEALLIVRDISTRKQVELALQHQLKKEQTLSRVIQTIRNSLDLNTIFATAVTEVANFLQVDQVGIVQYLPERNSWLTVAEHLSHWDTASIQNVEIPDAGNRLADRLKQLDLVRINDTHQLGFYDAITQELAQIYPGAWLIVPLHFGATVWGGLELMQCRRSYIWQDAEVELVQAMADQIAIAIQQSQLYQQVTQFNLNLEHQVQQRTTELQQALEFEALLKRITDKVRDSLDPDQILQAVVEELSLLPDVRYCNTALYNMAQQTVTVHHTADPHRCGSLSDNQAEPVLPPSDFPEIYSQFYQGLSFQFCSSSPKLKQGWVMALGCPIVDRQTVLGDLLLIKERDAVFNELEIRFIQQVANQCAIALRQSRLYQTVQSHAEALESLNRLKDEFLNTVSHELRSPMSNINMATQMLELTLISSDALDSQSQRYFQILKEECDRETSLIDDLLDLSRLESGCIDLSLTSIQLQHWIPHIAEPFEERIRQQNQQLLYRLPDHLPPIVTDVFYLQRTLSELLHNACKYTPTHQKIIVAAEVEDLRNISPGDEEITIPWQFKISVVNTGVTIPDDERDRIFDKFYRIPNNDPWKHGGTGLGLALVKRLVECLGGTIQLESAAEQTGFTLLLPSRGNE